MRLARAPAFREGLLGDSSMRIVGWESSGGGEGRGWCNRSRYISINYPGTFIFWNNRRSGNSLIRVNPPRILSATFCLSQVALTPFPPSVLSTDTLFNWDDFTRRKWGRGLSIVALEVPWLLPPVQLLIIPKCFSAKVAVFDNFSNW